MLRQTYLGIFILIFLPVLAVASQPSQSLYSGMRWRSIGPYRSGNVYAVCGVPSDPTVYYLGLPEGGVWKTTDGGTVWEPIFDQEAVPSIGSVAVAPSSPNIVYVGTGDPTGWSFTSGHGVFKSTDAGRHWTKLSLSGTAYIPRLLVDPHDPKLVLVAAQGKRDSYGAATTTTAAGGVFRTTDGGLTWNRTTALGSGVVDMAWDYKDPKMVYAVLRRGTEEMIYKSTDEGASWKALSGTGLPTHPRGMTVAVASGLHGRRAYLLIRTTRTAGRSGVYRSDDGGATWHLTTTKVRSANGHIYVAPSNPDEVYLMGTALYRSLNGGKSFTIIKGSPGGDDYRALWIDPTNPSRMIAGVDQGPTISVDDGKTWTPWYNLPNGQFYNVVTDNQFPYMVYGPQQDSGAAAVRSRGAYGAIRPSDWFSADAWEYGSIAVDPLNPRWIYSTGTNNILLRLDRKTRETAIAYAPTPKERFIADVPTVFSPTDPHRLYIAAQYVLATDDGGKHWHKLGGDLTRRSTPTDASSRNACGRRGCAISWLAPSPLNGQVLWAGTNNGLIQLSRDGGHTWHNVSPPQLTASFKVVSIDASHHDPATAYVAAEGTGDNTHPYLFRTTDYGKTWHLIVAGLPDNIRARVVREDPKNSNLLYAGTEMGVWVSFDRGSHWQPLQLNLPHTVVSGIQVHANDLVISTYGRALWILDDVTPLRQIREAMDAPNAYFFQPETAMRVHWSSDFDTPEPPEMPVGQNPPDGAILDYYLAAPDRGPMMLSIYDSSGRLVRKYSRKPPPPDLSLPNVAPYWFQPPAELGTAAGMHRFVWDLRYPTPKSLNLNFNGKPASYTTYEYPWHSIKGHTPRVVPEGPLVFPGTYQVKLLVNGRTYTRKLTVKNDPNSPTDAAGLKAQFALEQRVMTGMNSSANAYQAISAQQQTLATTESNGSSNARVLAAAKALTDKLAPLTAGRGSGFGAANRNLSWMMHSLNNGDYRPNHSVLAAVQTDCDLITVADTTLLHIETQVLPKLNRALTSTQIAPVHPITVTESACNP